MALFVLERVALALQPVEVAVVYVGTAQCLVVGVDTILSIQVGPGTLVAGRCFEIGDFRRF